jgi:hypothetical protein
MTILEALETEVSNLSRRVRFEYSTLDLANATIFDQIESSNFPVCLVLAFDIQDVSRENGKVISTAEVNTLFLDRAPAESIDKPIQEIESEFVSPMRALTRELVNRLDLNDIIEEGGIESLVNRSVHEATMDAHLYGNWGVFTVRFSEDISTCLPS